MDQFRKLCRDELLDERYFSTNPQDTQREYRVFGMRADSDVPARSRHEPTGTSGAVTGKPAERSGAQKKMMLQKVTALELLDCLRPSPLSGATNSNSATTSSTATESVLRLVEIPVTRDNRPQILPHVFLELLEDVLGMDPAALWLVAQEYDGFHHLAQSRNDSKGSGNGDTWFFGCGIFVMLWIHHEATDGPAARAATTNAIFIRRPLADDAVLDRLLQLLERHHHLGPVAYSPAIVGYVVAMTVCELSEAQVGKNDWRRVREIEVETGYRKSMNPAAKPKLDIVDTSSVASCQREISEAHINTLVFRRMLGASRQVLVMGQDLPQLREAILLLRSRINASDEFMGYMIVRMERLSGVLFALLTHYDAEASIKLADAAKKDGSSMKTIAYMTMSFLPATFFATLFAVPSLDWKSDHVVQSNHWVYWAFTVPATLLVFIIWRVLISAPWLRMKKKAKSKFRPAKSNPGEKVRPMGV